MTNHDPCPYCQRSSTATAVAAGREVRCHHCGKVGPILVDQGNPFADPDSDTDQTSTPTSDNPYAAPQTSVRPESATSDIEPSGLPWETEHLSFATFWTTARWVLLSADTAFRRMSRPDTVRATGRATFFTIIGGVIGLGAMLVWHVAVLYFSFPDQEHQPDISSLLMVLPVGIPLAIFSLVVFQAIVLHLLLTILGAARSPFDSTYRVSAYGFGAGALLGLIPVGGPYLFGLAYIVILILGSAAVHKASRGRAAMAVLIPYICALLGVLIVIGLAHGSSP